MGDLTSQQEKFCRLVAEGNTQSDAYRMAYPKSKANKKSMNEKASRLMAQSNISSRVSELIDELKEKSMWTREESVKILKNLLHADDIRKSDIINAIKELNKMHGFEAAQKIEHKIESGNVTIEVVGKEPKKQ